MFQYETIDLATPRQKRMCEAGHLLSKAKSAGRLIQFQALAESHENDAVARHAQADFHFGAHRDYPGILFQGFHEVGRARITVPAAPHATQTARNHDNGAWEAG